MLPLERRRRIVEELNIQGRVRVDELMELCQVSAETIRRNLSRLEKEGILQRSYGGAVAGGKQAVTRMMNTNRAADNELPFRDRMNEYVQEKTQIAKKALAFISPGDCILLDSSTTCWFLARQLPDMELTVLTNSLHIVRTLAAKSSIRTICLGGEYSAHNEDFNGLVAEQPLKEFLINKAFFSCSSIGNDGYLRAQNENNAHLKQQMLLASERKYYLSIRRNF
ncbi:MAG: putative HTH-type transcriptional regulator YdjF [Candidatus Erwinia impunctatus]|nr:putative HTH-type transcriptional regulator YdjF [Culicoides impunctatus]